MLELEKWKDCNGCMTEKGVEEAGDFELGPTGKDSEWRISTLGECLVDGEVSSVFHFEARVGHGGDM